MIYFAHSVMYTFVASYTVQRRVCHPMLKTVICGLHVLPYTLLEMVAVWCWPLLMYGGVHTSDIGRIHICDPCDTFWMVH